MKRIEVFQNKEIDAALEFMKLNSTIQPKKIDPNEEWPDACNRIVMRLEAIQTQLDNFRMQYGLFIAQAERESIESCIALASLHKFDIEDPEQEASPEALDAVERLLQILNSTEALISANVRQ